MAKLRRIEINIKYNEREVARGIRYALLGIIWTRGGWLLPSPQWEGGLRGVYVDGKGSTLALAPRRVVGLRDIVFTELRVNRSPTLILLKLPIP